MSSIKNLPTRAVFPPVCYAVCYSGRYDVRSLLFLLITLAETLFVFLAFLLFSLLNSIELLWPCQCSFRYSSCYAARYHGLDPNCYSVESLWRDIIHYSTSYVVRYFSLYAARYCSRDVVVLLKTPRCWQHWRKIHNVIVARLQPYRID